MNIYRQLRALQITIIVVSLQSVNLYAAEKVDYRYDSLNRLTNMMYSTGGSISYGYDKGGNRVLLSVITPNRPPLAGNDSLGTMQDQPANAPIVKLLANDTDPDNDTLSVSGVSSTSTNGAPVVLNPGQITYSPVAGFFGEDRFTYTLSDGRGGFSAGTVVVTVRDGNAPSLSQATITTTANGKQIRFAGIPGQNYVVQSAGAVTGPWTDLSGTLTAGLTGIVVYEDNEEPPPATRFYRIIAVP